MLIYPVNWNRQTRVLRLNAAKISPNLFWLGSGRRNIWSVVFKKGWVIQNECIFHLKEMGCGCKVWCMTRLESNEAGMDSHRIDSHK